MGIINIFKSSSKEKKEEKSNIEWHQLSNIEQLNHICEESNNTIVGIFKHSTRCSISRGVLSQFEQKFSEELPIKMYYLDLLNHRNISNEIAERFQVIHQSPQLLLVKKGETIAHASHYEVITAVDLQQFLK